MISNWRNELREVVDEIESKAAKKVKETKGINNKIIINPKLGEAVEEIGGELIEMKEVDGGEEKKDSKDDAQVKQKEKQGQQMKKRVLLAKLRAVRSGGGADIMASYEPEIQEAKVDKGRSDYGKASIRNYRRSGPGHGEPAMFDSENKRGKTIDKRREEHKARRGVKGAKVPAYKVDEAVKGVDTDMRRMAAQDRAAGKDKKLSPSRGKANVAKMYKDIKHFQKLTKEEVIAEKSLTAGQRRELPNSDFVFPGKGEGPEGKQRGAYPINDKKRARAALSMAAAHASPEKEAKVKAAVKKKFPDIQQEENALEKRAKENEKARKFLKKDAKDSGYTDIALKASMSKGAGVSESAMTLIGRARKKVEKKPEKAMDAGAKARRAMKRREHAKYVSGSTDNVPDDIREEDKAFNFVLDKIKKEVGKSGYISKNNPRKPQSDAEKAKVRAHQAKVDKENAAARAKDPSQGRYPKG